MFKKQTFIFMLSVCCVSFLQAHHKDVAVVENVAVPASQKEAILILPGFGSKIHGVKHIRDYFSHKGYDVFIPHYIGRDSLQQCVETVNRFMEKHKLQDYKKLHVFSYIAGSWVLNLWLKKHPVNNIFSIVYDRSPLQERAPYVLVKDNRFIIKLLAGNIMEQFSKTPYPAIKNDEKQLGVIIENKPTKLIRKHKKTTMSLGTVKFDLDSLHQSYDDYTYQCIDHDELYYKFDEIGPEILYFFKFGSFRKPARRHFYDYDLFNKRCTNCVITDDPG